MKGFNNRLNITGKLVNQKIKSEKNIQNITLKDKMMENKERTYKISTFIGRKGLGNIIFITEDRMEEQQYIRALSKTADTQKSKNSQSIHYEYQAG